MTMSGSRQADSYKTSDYLIRTKSRSAWFPVLVILAGLGVSGLLGIALFVADQFVYVYILYNALIGYAIGWTIAQAPRRSKYANRGVLLSVTVLCSALAYLVFTVAIYLLVFDGAEADGIDNWVMRIGHFFGILALRATNEPFLFGVQPGIAGSLVVWVAEFGITFYVAWMKVSAAIRLRHTDNTLIEAEPGSSMSQATQATKYFWRVLWLVYAAFLVFLSYEIVLDEVAIGTNISYLAMTLFIDLVGVAGLIFYAFQWQPAKIKRVWQSVFPILIASALIANFVESPLMEGETTAFEWTLLLLFVLLLLFPIYYANYRLAYKNIRTPRRRRKPKLSKPPGKSTRDSVCDQQRHLAQRRQNWPHSPAAWIIVGLSLAVSSAPSLARDGDNWLNAAFTGNLRQVRTLLTQGAEIDFRDERGFTALMLASLNGREEIVKVLLANGAEIDNQQEDGYTALMMATQNGHEVIVKDLLANGAESDMQGEDGYTALLIASQIGHKGIVQALLAEGADVNNPTTQSAYSPAGVTALMLASGEGHVGVVEALLANGAEVNDQNENGFTALMSAAGDGHEGIVQTLLAGGADANKQTIHSPNFPAGVTALMLASREGHEEIVKALLANGADVNVQSENGVTALFGASMFGHEGIVQALLANGAAISLQNYLGNTALILASAHGHEEIVKILIAEGAAVNYRGQFGATALFAASQQGHEGAVQTLLANRAQIDVQSENGYTALISAAQLGHEDIVRALLNKGAEIDHRQEDGATALMLASQNGHEGIVRALLAKGADVSIQSNEGRPALTQASMQGHEGIVLALLDNGAEIDVQDEDGFTALMLASMNGNQGTVQTLIAKGANVDLKLDDGRTTALSLAKTRQMKRMLKAAASNRSR